LTASGDPSGRSSGDYRDVGIDSTKTYRVAVHIYKEVGGPVHRCGRLVLYNKLFKGNRFSKEEPGGGRHPLEMATTRQLVARRVEAR
jgi:hypothetical protein